MCGDIDFANPERQKISSREKAKPVVKLSGINGIHLELLSRNIVLSEEFSTSLQRFCLIPTQYETSFRTKQFKNYTTERIPPQYCFTLGDSRKLIFQVSCRRTE